MADDFKILLGAAIDIQKSQSQLNSQIEKLKTESLKLGIEIDNTSAKKAIQKITKETQNAFKFDAGRIQLDNNITSYLKNNSKLSDDLKSRLLSVQKQIKSVDQSDLGKLKQDFRSLVSEANALGKTGDNAFTKLNKNVSQFISFLSSATVVMTGINGIRNMVEEVKNLDDSLVELRKVSDLTGDSLSSFIDKAYKAGSEVARTGKDVIDATTEFKRAGYTLDQSFDLAKASLVMTNVGDGIRNVEQASSALIATLKGFKLSDTDAMSVIDMINETSNNAAIDFDNITEGLRRVSGTLSQTGTSIQQTIGLLTGGFGSLRDIEMVSSGKQKAPCVQKCA